MTKSIDLTPFCSERTCRDNRSGICHFDGCCARKFLF
jgi:hypothetical protein